MNITEPQLSKYICDTIDEKVLKEDRKAFVESLIAQLEGKVFLSDIDIEEKYGDILAILIHDVNFADETVGININPITAALGREYLLS